jgi:hypothetical protein
MEDRLNVSEKLVSSPRSELRTSRIQVRGNMAKTNIKIKTGVLSVMDINTNNICGIKKNVSGNYAHNTPL